MIFPLKINYWYLKNSNSTQKISLNQNPKSVARKLLPQMMK